MFVWRLCVGREDQAWVATKARVATIWVATKKGGNYLGGNLTIWLAPPAAAEVLILKHTKFLPHFSILSLLMV